MLSMDCKNRGGNVFVRIYSTTYIYILRNLMMTNIQDCILLVNLVKWIN